MHSIMHRAYQVAISFRGGRIDRRKAEKMRAEEVPLLDPLTA